MLIYTRLFFLPFLEKYKFCGTLFFFKQKSQVLYRPYCKIWNLNVESYASWNFVMTERMQKYVSQSKFYCIIDIHACTFWIIILCYISPYSYPLPPPPFFSKFMLCAWNCLWVNFFATLTSYCIIAPPTSKKKTIIFSWILVLIVNV